MSDTIKIEIGDRAVLDALAQLLDKGRNMTPAMRAISTELASLTELAFQRQGPGWAPLADSTILSRLGTNLTTKKGNTRSSVIGKLAKMKILQDSGQLAASIQTAYGPTFAQIGSNKVYAAIHQFGGKTKPHTIVPRNKKALAFGGRVVRKVNHPGSTIPARPFIPIDNAGNLTPEAQASVLEILQNFLTK